jgi:hypothetical protein
MAGDREAPRNLDPWGPGVVDPETRRRDNGRARLVGRRKLQPELTAGRKEVSAGQGSVDAEGSGHEPGPRGQAVRRKPGQAGRRGGVRRITAGSTSRDALFEPGAPHRVFALERLDGADEDRGRPADGLGHDVQAVVHPVDKVHVGDPRRPVHDRVPGGPAEAGVRRTVVFADVRLDLDDPAPSLQAVAIFPDEVCTEESRGDLERRSREKRRDVAQERPTKYDWMSVGIRSPKTFMKPGMRRDRRISAVKE